MGKNARKRAARNGLHSGMSGAGGRFTTGNGHASHATDRNSHAPRRERPYQVIGTTAGQYSTAVAHNSTRIWRDER